MSELDGVFYKEIVEQALREFPNESCGVIAAADGVPVKVFPMKNADASPVTYRLDGKEQLQVFDEIDDQGWDLWAIYHSHTHSEAYPSETDIRLALLPGRPLHPAVAARTASSPWCARSTSPTARSPKRSWSSYERPRHMKGLGA